MPKHHIIPATCEQCGAPFKAAFQVTSNAYQRFCSRACYEIVRQANVTPPEVRFWRFVNKDGPIVRPELGPCWLWTGALHNNNYGNFSITRRRMVYAHRYSWEIHHGHPGDMSVLHKCDVRNCIRESHLFLGSQMDNIRDMHKKGRANDVNKCRGQAHHLSKLTEGEVRRIRSLRDSGERVIDIAKMFGIVESNVWNIVSRRTWKHVA